MPRPPRRIEPDLCYHVINRGNGRQRLFHQPGDYQAFVAILADALQRFDVHLLCWCLMPNHWHLVLRPRRRRAMIDFMRWITVTHARRRHEHYHSDAGHLYQGRYKSFPVEQDRHFLVLCRYVEANALRAKLVKPAQAWPWSSLHQRDQRIARSATRAPSLKPTPKPTPTRIRTPTPAPALAAWPVERPRGWIALVNQPLEKQEQQRLRESIRRERPLGCDSWVKKIAAKLGLQQTLRPRGRPRRPLESLGPRQRRRRKGEQVGHIGK
jgi:putative transposase